MKNFKILGMLMVALGIIACNPNEPESGQITGVTEDVYFEQVGEIQSIGYKEHYEEMIKQASEGNDEMNAVWLEYAKAQMDSVDAYQQECINQAGANWDVGSDGAGDQNRLMGYEYATIRYKSVDHTGKEVMLSTLVVWPFNNIVEDPYANNIVIGCHVTITSNAERPTNYKKLSVMTDVGMLACCAKTYGLGKAYENLVIIPDYQGYGATHGEVHPYLQQNVTARQVVDGVIAGKAYYERVIKHKMDAGWHSIATGYSQGGSVAMAVHRYIEQNNLVNQLNFVGSICGAGPYDPIATMQKYIKDNKVYMPVAAALLVHSMCNTNQRLMNKYQVEDYVTTKCIDSGMFDYIKQKKLNTDEITLELLDYSAKQSLNDSDSVLCMYRQAEDDAYYPYCKENKDSLVWKEGLISTSYAKTTDLLLPEVIDWFNGKKDPKYKGKMEALEKALQDNILHEGWRPDQVIYLHHTAQDEVVPFVNYSNCLQSWKNSRSVKGKCYVGLTQSHVKYGEVFYMVNLGISMNMLLLGTYDLDGFDDIFIGI